MSDPVLELTDVSKDYHGLRPLRISRLTVAPGEQVALLGFDQATAEIFVNLVTGATLPNVLAKPSAHTACIRGLRRRGGRAMSR